MERDTTINTISIRQLGTLLVLALLPLGTEVLPSRLSQAGGAAWLCPLGAGGVLLALVALWGRWITPGEDLLRTLEQQKGRKVLRGFALVLLAWGLFLTGAQGARIGERLAQSLRASPLLLTAAGLAHREPYHACRLCSFPCLYFFRAQSAWLDSSPRLAKFFLTFQGCQRLCLIVSGAVREGCPMALTSASFVKLPIPWERLIQYEDTCRLS